MMKIKYQNIYVGLELAGQCCSSKINNIISLCLDFCVTEIIGKIVFCLCYLFAKEEIKKLFSYVALSSIFKESFT